MVVVVVVLLLLVLLVLPPDPVATCPGSGSCARARALARACDCACVGRGIIRYTSFHVALLKTDTAANKTENQNAHGFLGGRDKSGRQRSGLMLTYNDPCTNSAMIVLARPGFWQGGILSFASLWAPSTLENLIISIGLVSSATGVSQACPMSNGRLVGSVINGGFSW
ncbi:hypothetical protein BKA67DRAFT_531316 [Truncatella angustata]|uniref:Uncharacterized protein n=1 Tax=Truncatella angustata TaxID=152316 RepID=A0A9P8UZI9_9PEZI|nr:uncharacterized protein BKA67DRAFT_531316 [Truncatella angustata]KAH6661257.1 hypothetical protein BKA67DRAFT_531316 [Truncatella angustata]